MPDPWSARHGDTWASPTLAVLGADGGAFSLQGWTVRAQARKSAVSDSTFFTWPTNRVTVGSAVVSRPDQDDITTASVQLHLEPSDFANMPLRWVGAIEIDISNGTDNYTILPERRFEVFPDLSR